MRALALPLTVVTGWSPTGWEEYGRRFYESFVRHWPPDVQLVIYGEAPPPEPLPRATFRLLSSIPGCMAFLKRHQDSALARGRVPHRRWKPRALAAGYNWRFDAWKFCRQAFIPEHAAAQCTTPLLCWLDGDVVTFADVPPGAIARLLPADLDLAYLGRGAKHSEIGFQLYRLTRDAQPVKRVLHMLSLFRELYDSDAVFQLPEWHSAWCWDHAREIWMDPDCAHNLTPGGTGHVWFQSPLKQWMDHLKGDRKHRGRSEERR